MQWYDLKTSAENREKLIEIMNEILEDDSCDLCLIVTDMSIL